MALRPGRLTTCRVPPTHPAGRQVSTGLIPTDERPAMNPRRLFTILLISSFAALLAGCGSSSKGSSSSSSTAAAPANGSKAGTSSKAPASPAEVKAATAECKRIIASASKLTANAKTKLEGACSAAAKGDLTTVKKVAKEVCEEAISTSSLPPASKEKAAAACSKA
jgi:hypothetical protein